MGPYCQFCGHRCFVPRNTPPRLSTPQYEHHTGTVLMATCSEGMEHDRKMTGGFDHTTAFNPQEAWR
jgi:hypothetical protein